MNTTKKIIGVSLAVTLIFGLAMATAVATDSSTRLIGKVTKTIEAYYPKKYYPGMFSITATTDGQVEITGKVNAFSEKRRVYEIVAKIPGVTAIQNKMQVESHNLPDATIQERIQNELRRNLVDTEPSALHVNVKNGAVILSGQVKYYRDKLQAENITVWQRGVRAIENKITLAMPAEGRADSELKWILEDIFARQFPLQKKVTFEVNNGVVKLTGKTTTLWANENIEKEFMRVFGVKEVINHLSVDSVTVT